MPPANQTPEKSFLQIFELENIPQNIFILPLVEFYP